MAAPTPNPRGSFRQRLPFLIAVGVGVLLWQTGAFGFLATQRTITWRFPVSYSDVRSYEVQIWDGDELLVQQERNVPTGLSLEPEVKVALSRGTHRAIAKVRLANATEALGFQQEFDPAGNEVVVLEMKKP